MKKWFVIGSVALIVLGGGAYLAYQGSMHTSSAAAPVGLSEDLPLEADKEIVSAEGRVVPVRQAMLAFLDDGRVEAVLVAEGDQVQAGEALVRLDTTDQDIAVRQAEAAVSLAEANLGSAESGLELAQIGLDSAHLAVRGAKADLALLEAGATAEQVALSEAAIAVAEAGIEQASGSRAVALEGASDAQIASAQAEVAYALAQYDNALKAYQPVLQNPDTNPDDRLQASLRLEAAQAALAAAQSRIDRLQAGATGSERVAADSGVDVATNQRDGAQAQLDLLLSGARDEQITIARANIASAEMGVAEAEGRVAGAETSVEQARAALLEADASLNAAKEELERRTLTAPFGGTVAAVKVKEGEVVQAGLPAAVLADLSQWQIETTDLTEIDVVALAPGLPVAVELDAFPDVTLRGEVRDIAATAAVLRGDVSYITTIDLVEPGGLALRWGMTAFVQVLTDEDGHLPESSPSAPLVSRVEAQGQVVPQSYVDVAPDMGGRVAAIPVSRNDMVARGDALVELEADAVQLALEQSNARVAAAEAGLAATQNRVALAEVAVAKAEEALTIAQANLELVTAGPRPAEVAAARAELAAAESAVAQAEAGRDVALDIVSDADIAAAEANLALATAELRALEENYQQILDACFDTPSGDAVCPLYGTVEEQVRGQLQAAQANQAAAQALLDWLNAGPTSAQRSAAGGAVALAVANRDLAQAQLDLLLAAASPEQIEEASVSVAQAELGIKLAAAQVREAEAAVMQAEAALAAARAGRDAVQATLDRMTLWATTEGVVTSIGPNPGEMVAPGSPVATLADLTGWLVETTDLSELDVPYISVGDAVDVRFDAIPDRTVVGVVMKIAEMPDVALGEVVYQVTVRLEEAPDSVRWGMTASIQLDVD
jgi:HlyD family secretion protein